MADELLRGIVVDPLWLAALPVDIRRFYTDRIQVQPQERGVPAQPPQMAVTVDMRKLPQVPPG